MSAPLTECVDCVRERERKGEGRPKHIRPVTYLGPRTPVCHTHKLQRKRLAKAGAHETRVRKIYGLEPGQYGELYLYQGKRCAICGRATGATRKLSVDHDHKTGLVRGLLCRPCNDILGHLRDDPEAARRLVRYLVQPPAAALGIRAVHEDNRREGST